MGGRCVAWLAGAAVALAAAGSGCGKHRATVQADDLARRPGDLATIVDKGLAADFERAKTTYKRCIGKCTKDSHCCHGLTCTPNMYSCTKQRCKPSGCKGDKECIGGRTCRQVPVTSTFSMGVCGFWCTADSQCAAPEKCVFEWVGVPAKECGRPCTSDTQCTAGENCKDKKYCVDKAVSCRSNADCGKFPWMDVCDVTSGMCGCSSDEACKQMVTVTFIDLTCDYIPF